jgi:hypothetical protein
MSISDATLIIGYSFPEYGPVYVKRTFDAIFGEGFVEYVTEKVFTIAGRPTYKKFYLFIHDQDHPALKQIKHLIANYKFAKIGYKNEWDRKTRKYVDRYWKVYDTPNRPEFKPYLITETPLNVVIEPWSAEADAAFEWQQIGKDCRCPSCLLHPITYDDDVEDAMPRITTDDEDADAEASIAECRPPTMERDNGGPYKMVRAVNMAATQTEEDPKDDSYWEDYWKLQGPPKLVRQTNKMPPTEDEAETTPHLTEPDDWDGLAKSLDEFMEKLPKEQWFDMVSGN